MNIFKMEYKVKEATEEEIYLHLEKCNDSFYPKLDERVNIKEYSKKIFENSITFEAWEGPALIGLIATYFNDRKNRVGYITVVCIINDYVRTGIAAKLMSICIGYAERQNIREIQLEVFKENAPAIHLYERFKFGECGKKDDFIMMNLKLRS